MGDEQQEARQPYTGRMPGWSVWPPPSGWEEKEKNPKYCYTKDDELFKKLPYNGRYFTKGDAYAAMLMHQKEEFDAFCTKYNCHGAKEILEAQEVAEGKRQWYAERVKDPNREKKKRRTPAEIQAEKEQKEQEGGKRRKAENRIKNKSRINLGALVLPRGFKYDFQDKVGGGKRTQKVFTGPLKDDGEPRYRSTPVSYDFFFYLLDYDKEMAEKWFRDNNLSDTEEVALARKILAGEELSYHDFQVQKNKSHVAEKKLQKNQAVAGSGKNAGGDVGAAATQSQNAPAMRVRRTSKTRRKIAATDSSEEEEKSHGAGGVAGQTGGGSSSSAGGCPSSSAPRSTGKQATPAAASAPGSGPSASHAQGAATVAKIGRNSTKEHDDHDIVNKAKDAPSSSDDEDSDSSSSGSSSSDDSSSSDAERQRQPAERKPKVSPAASAEKLMQREANAKGSQGKGRAASPKRPFSDSVGGDILDCRVFDDFDPVLDADFDDFYLFAHGTYAEQRQRERMKHFYAPLMKKGELETAAIDGVQELLKKRREQKNLLQAEKNSDVSTTSRRGGGPPRRTGAVPCVDEVIDLAIEHDEEIIQQLAQLKAGAAEDGGEEDEKTAWTQVGQSADGKTVWRQPVPVPRGNSRTRTGDVGKASNSSSGRCMQEKTKTTWWPTFRRRQKPDWFDGLFDAAEERALSGGVLPVPAAGERGPRHKIDDLRDQFGRVAREMQRDTVFPNARGGGTNANTESGRERATVYSQRKLQELEREKREAAPLAGGCGRPGGGSGVKRTKFLNCADKVAVVRSGTPVAIGGSGRPSQQAALTLVEARKPVLDFSQVPSAELVAQTTGDNGCGDINLFDLLTTECFEPFRDEGYESDDNDVLETAMDEVAEGVLDLENELLDLETGSGFARRRSKQLKLDRESAVARYDQKQLLRLKMKSAAGSCFPLSQGGTASSLGQPGAVALCDSGTAKQRHREKACSLAAPSVLAQHAPMSSHRLPSDATRNRRAREKKEQQKKAMDEEIARASEEIERAKKELNEKERKRRALSDSEMAEDEADDVSRDGGAVAGSSAVVVKTDSKSSNTSSTTATTATAAASTSFAPTSCLINMFSRPGAAKVWTKYVRAELSRANVRPEHDLDALLENRSGFQTMLKQELARLHSFDIGFRFREPSNALCNKSSLLLQRAFAQLDRFGLLGKGKGVLNRLVLQAEARGKLGWNWKEQAKKKVVDWEKTRTKNSTALMWQLWQNRHTSCSLKRKTKRRSCVDQFLMFVEEFVRDFLALEKNPHAVMKTTDWRSGEGGRGLPAHTVSYPEHQVTDAEVERYRARVLKVRSSSADLTSSKTLTKRPPPPTLTFSNTKLLGNDSDSAENYESGDEVLAGASGSSAMKMKDALAFRLNKVVERKKVDLRTGKIVTERRCESFLDERQERVDKIWDEDVVEENQLEEDCEFITGGARFKESNEKKTHSCTTTKMSACVAMLVEKIWEVNRSARPEDALRMPGKFDFNDPDVKAAVEIVKEMKKSDSSLQHGQHPLAVDQSQFVEKMSSLRQEPATRRVTEAVLVDWRFRLKEELLGTELDCVWEYLDSRSNSERGKGKAAAAAKEREQSRQQKDVEPTSQVEVAALVQDIRTASDKPAKRRKLEVGGDATEIPQKILDPREDIKMEDRGPPLAPKGSASFAGGGASAGKEKSVNRRGCNSRFISDQAKVREGAGGVIVLDPAREQEQNKQAMWKILGRNGFRGAESLSVLREKVERALQLRKHHQMQLPTSSSPTSSTSSMKPGSYVFRPSRDCATPAEILKCHLGMDLSFREEFFDAFNASPIDTYDVKTGPRNSKISALLQLLDDDADGSAGNSSALKTSPVPHPSMLSWVDVLLPETNASVLDELEKGAGESTKNLSSKVTLDGETKDVLFAKYPCSLVLRTKWRRARIYLVKKRKEAHSEEEIERMREKIFHVPFKSGGGTAAEGEGGAGNDVYKVQQRFTKRLLDQRKYWFVHSFTKENYNCNFGSSQEELASAPAWVHVKKGKRIAPGPETDALLERIRKQYHAAQSKAKIEKKTESEKIGEAQAHEEREKSCAAPASKNEVDAQAQQSQPPDAAKSSVPSSSSLSFLDATSGGGDLSPPAEPPAKRAKVVEEQEPVAEETRRKDSKMNASSSFRENKKLDDAAFEQWRARFKGDCRRLSPGQRRDQNEGHHVAHLDRSQFVSTAAERQRAIRRIAVEAGLDATPTTGAQPERERRLLPVTDLGEFRCHDLILTELHCRNAADQRVSCTVRSDTSLENLAEMLMRLKLTTRAPAASAFPTLEVPDPLSQNQTAPIFLTLESVVRKHRHTHVGERVSFLTTDLDTALLQKFSTVRNTAQQFPGARTKEQRNHLWRNWAKVGCKPLIDKQVQFDARTGFGSSKRMMRGRGEKGAWGKRAPSYFHWANNVHAPLQPRSHLPALDIQKVPALAGKQSWYRFGPVKNKVWERAYQRMPYHCDKCKKAIEPEKVMKGQACWGNFGGLGGTWAGVDASARPGVDFVQSSYMWENWLCRQCKAIAPNSQITWNLWRANDTYVAQKRARQLGLTAAPSENTSSQAARRFFLGQAPRSSHVGEAAPTVFVAPAASCIESRPSPDEVGGEPGGILPAVSSASGTTTAVPAKETPVTSLATEPSGAVTSADATLLVEKPAGAGASAAVAKEDVAVPVPPDGTAGLYPVRMKRSKSFEESLDSL